MTIPSVGEYGESNMTPHHARMKRVNTRMGRQWPRVHEASLPIEGGTRSRPIGRLLS